MAPLPFAALLLACTVFLWGCVGALPGCAVPLSGCAPPADPAPAAIEHVVVLMLDGVRMEESLGDGTAIDGAATAELWPTVRAKLLPEATVVLPVHNPGITITGPAHCNLATGARIPFGNFAAMDGLGYYLPDIPSLFEELHRSGRGGAVIANTDLVFPMAYSMYPGRGVGAEQVLVTEEGKGQPATDDQAVLDTVLAHLREEGSTLIVANLHAADRAGHEGEEGEYPERVRLYDEALVAFWRAIQGDPDLADRTLLVVTADHGRHTLDEPNAWRNHGDACHGCRTMPMFWLGPGVPRGATLRGSYTLDDLGATLAAVLGLPLPYAEGRVLTEVLPALNPSAPKGEDLVAVGGALGVRRWTGELDVRTTVVLDGETVSSPEATFAEALRVASGGGRTYACWRELTLSATESAPWSPRCAERIGEAWADIGYPGLEVGPVWEPAMVVGEDGTLLLAVLTSVSMAVSDEGGVRLHTWHDGWSESLGGVDYANFAIATALAVAGETSWVAFATSEAGAEAGRFTRHVEVRRVERSDTDQVWTNAYTGREEVDTDGATWPRRERPALSVVDKTLTVAMVGYGEGGTTVLQTSALQPPQKVEDWSPLARLDPSGRVLAHVSPQFGGGHLYWARLTEEETVEVCVDDTAGPRCLDTGAPGIRGLAPADGGVYLSLAEGDTWGTTFLSP